LHLAGPRGPAEDSLAAFSFALARVLAAGPRVMRPGDLRPSDERTFVRAGTPGPGIRGPRRTIMACRAATRRC